MDAGKFHNWPCWWIFDAVSAGILFSFISPGIPFPKEWDVVASETIEGLAQAIGVDAATLAEQVRRFNADCAEGVDREFGRGERVYSQISYGDHLAEKHPNLGPVAVAPFYAMRPVLVGTGIPTTGLDTDPVGRVLDYGGQPIACLYAAGNSSAMLEVGGGYQSGIANMRSLIVARSAMRDAASRT